MSPAIVPPLPTPNLTMAAGVDCFFSLSDARRYRAVSPLRDGLRARSSYLSHRDDLPWSEADVSVALAIPKTYIPR
jgi:hypothetical protein